MILYEDAFLTWLKKARIEFSETGFFRKTAVVGVITNNQFTEIYSDGDLLELNNSIS